MSIIPIHVILPLCAVALTLLVLGAEASWYYAFIPWYYGSGPAVLRERWQTSGTIDRVRNAIRPMLHADGLVGQESPEGFCIRQKTVGMNTWPRIFLRIEVADRGAALHFEVRPFYSTALLMVPVVWLAGVVFRVGGGPFPYLATLLLIVVAGVIFMYKFLMPFDLKRINRLPSIRRALAPFGLRICEHCGYDLFGLENPQRCPECGRTCGDH